MYSGETDHAATVMPRNKPVMCCTPVRRVCLIKPPGPLQHSLSQFNAVLPGVATVWSRFVGVSQPGRTKADSIQNGPLPLLV